MQKCFCPKFNRSTFPGNAIVFAAYVVSLNKYPISMLHRGNDMKDWMSRTCWTVFSYMMINSCRTTERKKPWWHLTCRWATWLCLFSYLSGEATRGGCNSRDRKHEGLLHRLEQNDKLWIGLLFVQQAFLKINDRRFFGGFFSALMPHSSWTRLNMCSCI